MVRLKQMFLLAGLGAATVIGAAPVLAQCPTGADLGRGISVRFDTGDVSTAQRQGDGYLRLVEASSDGAVIVYRAHRGMYHVAEVSLGLDGQPMPETALEIVFPVDPASLPDPFPGTFWEGPTVNRFADGLERPETTRYDFSARDALRIGDCSYDAVQADVRYDWGADGGLTLLFAYLPGLGTTVLLSSQFDGDTVNSSVPVEIGLMSK